MSNLDAPDLFSKPTQSSALANKLALHGKRTLSANPAVNDVLRLCRIPAGFEAFRLTIVNDDLDSSGGPAIAFKAGFAYEDGSGGTDNAFVATGSTVLQSASAVAGTQFTVVPVLIDKPAFLTITFTAQAATFAAGQVAAIIEGIGRGPR